MAATSDWRLYQLYMEFGEAQDQRGRTHEAADAYALALYYARRMSDQARIQEARQLVLSRSPDHVAGQGVSAPLFFAQLLMRYPADEIEMVLAAGRPAPTVAVALEVDECAPPTSPDRTFRQAQAARPTFDRSAAENHRPESSLEQSVKPTSVIADDVLLAEAGMLGDRDEERNAKQTSFGDFSSAVKALAAGAVASGLLLIAYLGYSIYPMLNRLQQQNAEPAALLDRVVVFDDAERAPMKEETPKAPATAPKKSSVPAPQVAEATPPKIAEAGANTPVSLPDEPIAPPRISAKPAGGDESRK